MRRIVGMGVAVIFVFNAQKMFAVEIGSFDSVSSASRPAVFAGMSVSYINPQDVVDLINAQSVSSQRVSDFKSAVEFFGGVIFPLNMDWTLKAEYAYLLSSYNVDVFLGVQEYTITCHLPTLLLQYVLVSEPTYNVKAGGGAGYHFGNLETKLGGLEDKFSASGVGVKLDLEASSAFGKNVFAYFGADLRWDSIGDLTNGNNGNPSGAGTTTSLSFFSVGAKLGFSHYF